MVTPLDVVAETFAGGLGLVLLSCAQEESVANEMVAIAKKEQICFIIFFGNSLQKLFHSVDEKLLIERKQGSKP